MSHLCSLFYTSNKANPVFFLYFREYLIHTNIACFNKLHRKMQLVEKYAVDFINCLLIPVLFQEKGQ